MEYLIGFVLLILAVRCCCLPYKCDCGGRYNKLIYQYVSDRGKEDCYSCNKCNRSIKVYDY